MRRALHSTAFAAALAGGLLAMAQPVAAQALSADYSLTASALPPDAELPGPALLAIGPLLLAGASSANGSGLSLQAGQRWFARVGVGSSLEADVVSLGGGYRFAGGQALSMHVTRQLGQERLGLAVRYDFSRAWLRLGYEVPMRALGGPDYLRFSAGLRF
jgi:hypothetical protein